MSKIIIEKSITEQVYYPHEFEYLFERGCGFTFDCDKEGNTENIINKCAIDNYNWCKNNPDKINDLGIIKHIRKIKNPAILLCDCGEKVHLTNFTNTCDKCEADYNLFGQRLASRSQWGYETGEAWQDCY